MKRFLSAGALLLILIGGSLSVPVTARGQGAGLVSSILSKMERNRRTLLSLRAGISMEKYNAQLRDSEHYSGALVYKPSAERDASVRIEWSSPQHEILAVSKGEYVLFRPRLRMAYKGSAKSNRNRAGGVLDLMYLTRQQLEARFEPFQDVREETLWGGVSTTHIKLVPKGGASFKYAEVWVDANGMPVQTKVVEKNDDATTIRLSHLERNARVSADDFTVNLDSDVKIVRG